MIDDNPWDEHQHSQYHQRLLELLKQKQVEDIIYDAPFVDLNLLGPDDTNYKKDKEKILRAKMRQINNVSCQVVKYLQNLTAKSQTH